MDLAPSVERNYLILEYFFEDILHVPREIAREDACKIEHLLNPVTAEAMFRFVRLFRDKDKVTEQVRKRMDELQLAGCNQNCEICEEYDGCIGEDTSQFVDQAPMTPKERHGGA